MKPIFQKITGFLFALLIMINIINAQAPNMFNYQAVARTASGADLPNQSIGVQFTILDGSSTGSAVYQETQTLTTNSFGLFTAQIGGGTVVSGSISGINWGGGAKFLEVQIDPTGGTAYTVSGTSQLLSVPYALSAGGGLSGSGTVNTIAKFTSASAVGNSIISDNGTQVGIAALFGPYAGATLTVEGGTGVGKDSATVYVTNINPSGVGLYLRTNSGGTSEFIENTGSGPGLIIQGNNSQIAMYVQDAAGAFAQFGTGGSSSSVTITQGSNGSGSVLIASDSGATPSTTGNLWENTTGMHMGVNGTNVTTTSTVDFHPYNDNVFSLGNANKRWTAVWAVNGTIQTSDSRYKENVQPVQYGLNAIMQLNPVSYNWKDKSLQIGTGTNLGFLAQEVEKVLPDVIVHTVHTNAEIEAAKEETGTAVEKDSYGVKYAEFTPVLVKAIQEQQQIIAALQTQLQAQQQLTSNLQSQLQQLTVKVNAVK